MAGKFNAQDVKEGPAPCCISPCRNSNRFYVQGEALYWKASEDNTSFAEKDTITVENIGGFGSGLQTVSEKDFREELDFKWDPGVRVSAVFLFPSKRWDLDFNWTHFVTGTSKSVSAPNLDIVEGKTAPTLGTFTILSSSFLSSEEGELVSLTNLNQIDADWHLSFNNYEGTLGQMICASPCFDMRVFCGPKFVSIVQKYHFSYFRISDPNGFQNISGPGTGTQTIKTRFNGLGLQGGLQADWLLGCGFSIYSCFSGGITYGRVHAYDTTITSITTSDTSFTENETEKNKDFVWCTTPNIDLALGLEWDYCFRNRYLLALNIGWEFHNYFDQNFFRLPTQNMPTRGNLAFQGATFGAGLGF